MKKNLGREIALLPLPVLIIGGVAWWKNWSSDPRIYVDKPEVGAVSLEREIFLSSQQAERRVHLAAVVSWNREAVQSTPEFEVHGESLFSLDEELRAPSGRVWRSRDHSLDVRFEPGGNPQDRWNIRGKELNKLHWMVTIPADAPAQDLMFSAKVTAPGLEKKTVTFLARPKWKTVRPSSLKVVNLRWEHPPVASEYDTPELMAVVRLRYNGKKPLFCDRVPIRHAPKPAEDDYFNTRTFTPSASPQVTTLIWGEAQWVEDSGGKLMIQWRRAQGGGMNYSGVSCKTPYLDPQGLIVLRYVMDAAINKNPLHFAAPLRLKAQVGIVGEGILPLNLTLPLESKPGGVTP